MSCNSEQVPVSQDRPEQTGILEVQLYSTTKSGVDKPFFWLPQIEAHTKLSVSSAAATAKAATSKTKQSFGLEIIAILDVVSYKFLVVGCHEFGCCLIQFLMLRVLSQGKHTHHTDDFLGFIQRICIPKSSFESYFAV